MTSNAKNVYAAEPLATGSLIVFPLGTEPPAERDDPDGATAELPEGGIDLGHIGEDGFTETTERNTDKKRNFGGKVVKVLQTEYNHQLKFVFLESLNAYVLKAVYGDNNVVVSPADGTHGTRCVVRKNSRKLPRKTWCIDTTDTELNAFYRNWVPEGQIVELSDVVVVHSDTIMYEVTMECYEDPGGDHVITWTDDGNPQGEVIGELDDGVGAMKAPAGYEYGDENAA